MTKRRAVTMGGVMFPVVDASELRAALGIGPDEPVEVRGSMFERPAGAPAPGTPPVGAAGFDALRTLVPEALRARGLRAWDEPDMNGATLWLLPGAWYGAVPEGYPLECISGAFALFRRGETDDDTRAGMLAYGLRIAGAPDAAE